MSAAAAAPAVDDAALAAFQAERARLFAIAYRMLGSVREAEDAVQEAWVRWQGADRAAVRSPAAFLVRTVTRLCMDALRSARARRLEYVGPWLPEPLVQSSALEAAVHRPDELAALADDLSAAFLLLLERLTPVERAVFLLRESFDFPYVEIAPVVGKTEAHCRQIDRRARSRLGDPRRARPADPAEHDRLLSRFLLATREGDVEGLVALLAEDAVSLSDGGGRATAARRPVVGARNVARFVVGIASKAGPGVEVRLAPVNGRTGVLIYVDGRLLNVMTLHVEGGRVRGVYHVLNPEKLPRERAD